MMPNSASRHFLLLLCFRAVSALNNRHVCFLDSFSSVRGPHFAALFDQVAEQTGLPDKRVALCTLRRDVESATNVQPLLEEDLGLDSCDLIVLDDYNPLSLEQKMKQINPSILWVTDGNAFEMRYRMRTSGLDHYIERSCGPLEGSLARLYVGEGAGAICGGSTMSIAHLRDDDPKAAPEPQFRGIELLGSSQSVSFGIEQISLQTHSKTKDMIDTITSLRTDQVFVWSQQLDQVTNFVMSASRKGTLEKWQSPPPVPSLVEVGSGGVQCDGEPAVDPSRTVQQIGDSDWLD
jgi:hypothetical protein